MDAHRATRSVLLAPWHLLAGVAVWAGTGSYAAATLDWSATALGCLIGMLALLAAPIATARLSIAAARHA